MKKNLNIAYLNGADIGKKVINVVSTINNQDKIIEITENGSVEVVADNGYTGLGKVIVNVEVASSGGGWTGHADVEGLKAIGWTDEDITYYQANGVNWNEEDDQYHKVPEDNIALYGVLTASNISTYKNRIVYLPKIDTSKNTSLYNEFNNCYSLVSIPQLDTSSVTDISGMFDSCYSVQICNLKGLELALDIKGTSLLTKDSLLYIINNEAATSAITITLSSYCYTKYAEDADILAALANHPNVSLAK